jgi:CDP-diacylglycerol---serine O-phosphatidyltransferase
MKHVPNFITTLNLASGFIAIVFAANGHLLTASWLILAAMIFDFLDGFSARLLKAYSDLGKELDSLADVVSFGVAPAFIIYQLLNNSLALIAPAMLVSDGFKATVILLLPAVMPVFGALRLAIFNLDSSQATTFKGLPIPANALAVISIVIAGHFSDSPVLKAITDSPAILLVLTFALSFLMVSRIPMLSLKIKSLKVSGNEGRYILFGMVLIAFAIFGAMALPLIIPLYIVASLVSLLFQR